MGIHKFLASLNFHGLGFHLHLRSSLYVLLFVMVALFPKVSDAVFCYNCMVFQCDSSDQNCNAMKTFVQYQLTEYYDIGNQLPEACPLPSEDIDWTFMELRESSRRNCTESCISGNIKVISYNQGGQVFESRATILGCAKLNLVKEITIDLDKGVDSRTLTLDKQLPREEYSTGLSHDVKLRHYYKRNSFCNDKEFCVQPGQSLITEWKVDAKTSYWRWIVVAVLAVMVMLILFIGCNDALNAMIKDCCLGIFSRICCKCGSGSKESYDLREGEPSGLPLQSPEPITMYERTTITAVLEIMPPPK